MTENFKLPDDGWLKIVPAGIFPHPDTGLVQVFDAMAISRMAERFRADSTAPSFGGLLVDYDHFSYDLNRPSNSAGWVSAVDARGDGLYGKVRWSGPGLDAVESGSYRYFSPTFLAEDGERLADGSFRPFRLDSVALTNKPALPFPPITNRAGSGGIAGPQAMRIAEAIRNRADKILQGDRKMGFRSAWRQAESELRPPCDLDAARAQWICNRALELCRIHEGLNNEKPNYQKLNFHVAWRIAADEIRGRR